MAKYGFDDGAITWNSQPLTSYVHADVEFSVEAFTEEGHTLGDSWVEQLFTGLKQGMPFTLECFYDDVTNGPDDLFAGAEGTAATMVITWGSTKTSSFSAMLKRYTRRASRGQLHKARAEFLPTGAVTEV